MSRILITGTNSGCGKTTVTCAILAALRLRGVRLSAFKCGPDYVDPMFHRAVFGVRAYNLDPFFLGDKALRAHLAAHAETLSVIEGAMGYYDGIGETEQASAYVAARDTDTPAVLVVSARGAQASLGAVIEGFARHRPNHPIRGVIFNDTRQGRYPALARIAARAGIQAYGFLPRKEEWSLPGRHLGLLTADEIENLQTILAGLGQQAEQSVDIDGLLELAKSASALHAKPVSVRVETSRGKEPLRIAVARDEAFCFHYEENLELLQDLGCEPVFFSPLRDRNIPAGICGLYLGGGYPELYKEALSENASLLDDIRQAAENGLPTIAEGGGFLYLHTELDGRRLCGLIDGIAFETKQLRRFGYITLTAGRDNLLCAAGGQIRAQAFHYWDSSNPGEGFTAQKAGDGSDYPCVHATDSLYAGLPQLYLPANPDFAKAFVERMSLYEP